MKRLINKISREINSSVVGLFVQKIDRSYFSKIYNDAKKIYLANFKDFPYEEYMVPEWLKNIRNMENSFLNNFHFNFLRLPVIRATMFATSSNSWKKNQLNFLEKNLGEKELENLLLESNLGKPIFTDLKYKTSTNTIHLLYHFIKFSSETKVDLKNINTVVEFGGGYGDAARIFKKINKQSTYTIIDLPIFSFLQLVYLKSILGEDQVVLVNDVKDIETGKVNIVPFNIEKLKTLKESLRNVDLFLSTWALSETPDTTQNLIKSLNYFNAKYILMGYQQSNHDFAYSENVVKDITNVYKILYNNETEYVPGSYYLFCEKL